MEKLTDFVPSHTPQETQYLVVYERGGFACGWGGFKLKSIVEVSEEDSKDPSNPDRIADNQISLQAGLSA